MKTWQVQIQTFNGWIAAQSFATEYEAHIWRVITTATSHLLDEQTTRIVDTGDHHGQQ